MMGPSPRCYIPSFVEIGPLVLEKIFEGFSPYMYMSFDPDTVNKLLFPLPKEAQSTQNLALINQAVSE